MGGKGGRVYLLRLEDNGDGKRQAGRQVARETLVNIMWEIGSSQCYLAGRARSSLVLQYNARFRDND